MTRIVTRCVALAALACCASAQADGAEKEAIAAQVAAAMASADYATQHCAELAIDEARLQSLIKRSGKTQAQLKASEDYADQRDVIETMAKGPQAALICTALPAAHGGYTRGIITEK